MSQAGVLSVQTSGGLITETLTGNTGGPVGPDGTFNINIVGVGGVTVTGNPATHTLEISNTGSLSWNVISASQAMVANDGYICVSPGGALALSLPAASVLGDILEITLDGATSFSITQGAGQQIRLGSVQTTAGAAGTITTTAQGNSLRLVCHTANLKWNVLSSMGNFLIV